MTREAHVRRSTKVFAGLAVGAVPLLATQSAGAVDGFRESRASTTVTFTTNSGASVSCDLTAYHSWTPDPERDELFAEITSTAQENPEPCWGELRIEVTASPAGGDQEELSVSRSLNAEADQLTLYNVGERPHDVQYWVVPDGCDSSANDSCQFGLHTRTK